MLFNIISDRIANETYMYFDDLASYFKRLTYSNIKNKYIIHLINIFHFGIGFIGDHYH